ncbi:unnamed protein product, partial [Urochloa humidicola]
MAAASELEGDAPPVDSAGEEQGQMGEGARPRTELKILAPRSSSRGGWCSLLWRWPARRRRSQPVELMTELAGEAGAELLDVAPCELERRDVARCSWSDPARRI